MEQLNIAVLGQSELKWTEVGHFQSGNYKIFSGNDNHRRNKIALILRQDVAQAVRGYNTSSDCVMSIRILGKPINITMAKVCSNYSG